MLGLWRGLTRFLADPRIALDNNATERALRGMVIGPKNHYGSRSKRGTEVAALFYSLIESAKLCSVEPKAYLLCATRAALESRDRHPPARTPAGVSSAPPRFPGRATFAGKDQVKRLGKFLHVPQFPSQYVYSASQDPGLMLFVFQEFVPA